jgi:hypothetical protein
LRASSTRCALWAGRALRPCLTLRTLWANRANSPTSDQHPPARIAKDRQGLAVGRRDLKNKVAHWGLR